MRRQSMKERRRIVAGAAGAFALLLAACGSGQEAPQQEAQEAKEQQAQEVAEKQVYGLDDCYRTYYEVFVHSFYDSNADGIGDLKGLDEKLDYLNDADVKTTEDLGVNGIWLMPVMPSTTYHKYDVTDYMAIDPEYGTIEDFETLIADCKDRDIHVILDLVMNHTSSKHSWFVSACEYLQSIGDAEPDPAVCPYVGYYNFSREKEKPYYVQVPGTDWYYEAKFWSEMPDLDLNNEAVRQEFTQITKFWLEKGVAGFRLDAVKEFESDNTTENVAILTWFNDMVKKQKADAYLVAEAWTDVDTYAKYYESGIDSMFNFEFADSTGIIASSLKRAGSYDATSYGKAVSRLEDMFAAYNPDYIDAPFYTNHDMARSAGYYSGEYSQAQTKIAGAMNLFIKGSAFLYYGEELGMKGSGKDENKRLAFLWSGDAQAPGTCQDPKDAGSVKQKYGALDEQLADSASVYQFYKKVIQIRNKYPQIARGAVTFVEEASSADVCVLKKTWQEESIYLIFNLSQTQQQVSRQQLVQETQDASQPALSDSLTTTPEAVQSEADVLIMPGYSVAIMK